MVTCVVFVFASLDLRAACCQLSLTLKTLTLNLFARIPR